MVFLNEIFKKLILNKNQQMIKKNARADKELITLCRLSYGLVSIGTASANSLESDLGFTSRVYFYNVMLTSQK